jgi:uncharacterized membrane protein
MVNVVIFRGKRFMQKTLLASLVLVTVFGAGTVNAAEVFIKKNKTTTSAPQKQAVPSMPQGGVPNQGQEQVLPPSVQLYQPGVVPLGQQPCTEEDKKLVLALDKKVTAKRDPNATAGQVKWGKRNDGATVSTILKVCGISSISMRAASFHRYGRTRGEGNKTSKAR